MDDGMQSQFMDINIPIVPHSTERTISCSILRCRHINETWADGLIAYCAKRIIASSQSNVYEDTTVRLNSKNGLARARAKNYCTRR